MPGSPLLAAAAKASEAAWTVPVVGVALPETTVDPESRYYMKRMVVSLTFWFMRMRMATMIALKSL